MATYQDAFYARDQAWKLISDLGATVLVVKPGKDEHGNWLISVETARPLPPDKIPKEVSGVPIGLSYRKDIDVRDQFKGFVRNSRARIYPKM